VLEEERDQIESRLRITVDKLQEVSKIVDDYERFFLGHSLEQLSD